MKTVGIPENVHRELMNLKINYGYKNTALLLEDMVHEFRREKLLEASKEIRKKMSEKKISFKELMNRARKPREEIYDEWFR